LLNVEIFNTLREAQIIIEGWRRHYNTIRAACFSPLQATNTSGRRARILRMAGCATPTGSASHAGVTANSQLTFHLDHPMQADQPLFWIEAGKRIGRRK
jgi:hypothetical protein